MSILLTSKDLATMFQLKPATVNRMVRDGRLPPPDVMIGSSVRRWYAPNVVEYVRTV